MPADAPTNYAKIKAATADAVAVRIMDAGEEAASLLEPDMPPMSYFEKLVSEGLMQDAVRFLAAALPPREAVWWACTCARQTLPEDAAPADDAALTAADTWVYTPNEDNRRAASASADATGLDTAAGWAAMAAFWSGGSISEPDLPSVEPDPKIFPVAVWGAVILATVQSEPQLADDRYRDFIACGLDIANGGNGREVAAASE